MVRIDAAQIVEDGPLTEESGDVLHCSIKQGEIDQPQLLSDGHLYDRDQIHEWAQRRGVLTSPNTGLIATMIHSVAVENLVACIKVDREMLKEKDEEIKNLQDQLRTLAEAQKVTPAPYVRCYEMDTPGLTITPTDDTETDESIPDDADSWLQSAHPMSLSCTPSSSSRLSASAPWTDDSRQFLLDEMEQRNVEQMQAHLDEALEENLRFKEKLEGLQDDNQSFQEVNLMLRNKFERVIAEENKLKEEIKRLRTTVDKYKSIEYRRSKSLQRRNEQLRRNINQKLRAGFVLTDEEKNRRDLFHDRQKNKLIEAEEYFKRCANFQKDFESLWECEWRIEIKKQNEFDEKLVGKEVDEAIDSFFDKLEEALEEALKDTIKEIFQ